MNMYLYQMRNKKNLPHNSHLEHVLHERTAKSAEIGVGHVVRHREDAHERLPPHLKRHSPTHQNPIYHPIAPNRRNPRAQNRSSGIREKGFVTGRWERDAASSG